MNPFRRLLERIKKFSCKFSASVCRSKCSVNVDVSEEAQKVEADE